MPIIMVILGESLYFCCTILEESKILCYKYNFISLLFVSVSSVGCIIICSEYVLVKWEYVQDNCFLNKLSGNKFCNV